MVNYLGIMNYMVSSTDLNAILGSCDSLIAEFKDQSNKSANQRQTWLERSDAVLTKWGNIRNELVECAISCHFVKDGTLCQYCDEREALIICKQCKRKKHLCFVCDDIVHSAEPCHDRLYQNDKHLKTLTPCQGLNSVGEIINVGKWPRYSQLSKHILHICSMYIILFSHRTPADLTLDVMGDIIIQLE